MYHARVTVVGMRKEIYRGTDDEARALFARAPIIHLATTTAAGEPILRSLHAVLEPDGTAIAFHGAPAGEKMEGLGRDAVVSAEEIVASIPSYFVDPERACPATTYYVRAQAHGVLEEILDPEAKARVLDALMTKYQPEGGYVPIQASDPMYRKPVIGLLVARVRIARMTCKEKLGQNRSPKERARIVEQLWSRGREEDVRAIARLLERFADLPVPAFLRAPTGSNVRLSCLTGARDFDDAARLLEGTYWQGGASRAEIRASLARSSAVVGARDADGALVAIARAVSDGKVAWIYDVLVSERSRAAGLGTAVMRLLLEHPSVRGARHVRLTTRDAMAFYRPLGFRELAESPRHPWPSIEMIRSEGHPVRRAGIARSDDGDEARAR